MLKLNASFSKKVPVPGQDYSSQSYHASIEVELSDGLEQDELQDRIHKTFALVRGSVEHEINNGKEQLEAPAQDVQQQALPPTSNDQPKDEYKPSEKQIRYLFVLGKRCPPLAAMSLS